PRRAATRTGSRVRRRRPAHRHRNPALDEHRPRRRNPRQYRRPPARPAGGRPMTSQTTERGTRDDWEAIYQTHSENLTKPPPSPALTRPPDTEPAEVPTKPLSPSLEAWVTGYLAQIITAELGPAMRWCPQWWQHSEAVARLESLWRA